MSSSTLRTPPDRRPRPHLVHRALTLGLSLPLLATCALTGVAAPAAAVKADTGDGTVKVRVVREVNANGSWDRTLEPGMDQVEVTLTDDAGNVITAKTGADGVATFTPAGTALKGGKYRVQVMNPKPGVLYSAFASREGLAGAPNKLSSTEEFVDVSGGKNVEFTTAYWNPGDYCQKNAELATACIDADVPNKAPDSARTALVFPYNARGNDNQVTNLSTKGQTGSVYGVGYSKQKKWIFYGAHAHRSAAYGPDKQGAIYLVDRQSKETSLFTTVPDAGTTEHDFTDAGHHDVDFMPAVAKESLGDVEVSEDGSELYVVNLNDRKLYVYDATQKTAAAPKGSYAIPDPGCADAGDWRPYGLGVQDGVVYVGGVCSGESSQSKPDMRAVIRTFDPKAKTFGEIIMDEPLDFPRGKAFNGASCVGAGWWPWSDTFRKTQDNTTCGPSWIGYPQPILADIVVDTDGQLILGFRDRFADQVGMNTYVAKGDNTMWSAASGGDLNRACKGADGKFKLDGNGGPCPNNANSSNNGGQAANVREFYPGDYRTGYHEEAMYAGIALSKVEDTIASSAVDPYTGLWTGGTGFVNRDGTHDSRWGNKLIDGNTSFGKANSMADLEVLCDEAPIQIGNRVWYDVDKDGIQDPGEKPVPGATVNLYDENGVKVATTKTSARGEYYFDAENVPGGLKFKTKYTIKIDNADDYDNPSGPLYGWAVTKNDAGDNDFVDSDGKVPAGGRFPEHSIVTGDAGQDNHTYDFGYNQPTGPVTVVKVDADDEKKTLAGAQFQLWKESNGTDGLQMSGDKADTKVGDPVTSGADGKATVKDLAPGTYYWQETKAPAGYALPDPAVVGPVVLDAGKAADGATITAKDKPLPGQIILLKKDKKTGNPLPGAVFQLWRETNGVAGLQRDGAKPDTKQGTACATDAKGECAFDGPNGVYYLQETAVPEGYGLPANPVSGPYTIDAKTKKVTVTLDNSRKEPPKKK
ncbi:SpaA isopeptide-forming pilin-related protein (plasmid) [Streptomyces sp. BI20]|uniref:SpaA isopeptide-forming pilin-related protein n=1 Tax=Streptomyces sp. BI20 TaxID=3403460 RepID=UPI003C78367F